MSKYKDQVATEALKKKRAEEKAIKKAAENAKKIAEKPIKVLDSKGNIKQVINPKQETK